jgi:rare lipoprotein A
MKSIIRRSARMRVGTALSATAFALVIAICAAATAEAKTPGKTYCFNSICHRVLSIPEMVTMVGRDQVFEASYYDDCRRDRYNPCGLTSSGEAFRPNEADSAASPVYPDGTILLVRNPANGNAAVVRVNNAGPYWRRRKLDVSRAAAVKLGFAGEGVAKLETRVLSAPSIIDATYKRNRHYAEVPGPIGAFASLDQAQGGMMMAIALDAMSTSVFAPVAGKMLTAIKTMKPALANVLRTDPTRVASADGTVTPPDVVANFEKAMAVSEGPTTRERPRALAKKPEVVSYSIRRAVKKSAGVAKSRNRTRWAAYAAPRRLSTRHYFAGRQYARRQLTGTRSASSRSKNRVFFATASSSTKRSYWTSRASRKAAAMSRSGPRARRLATRKLSSIVRSDAVRIAAASGAMRPRLRT